MILSVLRTPNGNLLELRAEDGVYKTRLYQYVEDSEREIGVPEAKDLQSTVRALKALGEGQQAITIVDVR